MFHEGILPCSDGERSSPDDTILALIEAGVDHGRVLFRVLPLKQKVGAIRFKELSPSRGGESGKELDVDVGKYKWFLTLCTFEVVQRKPHF